MPELSVIVLNWNRRDLTEACVDSLRAHTDVDHELIIVDNGSMPEVAEWVSSVADRAVLNSENLGFAAGMNRGLEVATAPHVAFVNNDTVFPAEWASRLLTTAASHPAAGIVLPAVTAGGNPFSIRSEPGSGVAVATPFRQLPSGVVYMVRTDLMRAIGGWDERYVLAGREDIDLLFTMWANDLDVILDERVLVEHVSSATVDTQLPGKRDLWRDNWQRFIDKWSDPADIPAVGEATPETRAVRLREAATAAYWMSRWMEERQRYYAKNREWKQAVRELAQTRVTRRSKRPWARWSRS